jgi:uncharacterized protein (TIGR02646 family)
MRFVDRATIDLLRPADWDDKSKSALEYVENAMATAEADAVAAGESKSEIADAVKAARTKAINAKSKIWAEAGKILRKIMNEKCWYCETLEIRADMPVDHFRPKNKVHEAEKHDGYWWLAFDWTNYRFACAYCNSRHSNPDSSGGKADHFPLIDPDKRAWTRSDPLEDEEPELLDPCDALDPRRLTFKVDGTASFGSPDDERRARSSIEIYHLDEPRLTRERKAIAIAIDRKASRIKELVAKSQLTSEETKLLKEMIIDIVQMSEGSKRFCTAARCYLKDFRGIPLLSDVLDSYL